MRNESYKDYRLLVLDIDGTLLDDNNIITQNTYKSLKLLKEKDILITFATGRLYNDAACFARKLDTYSPMIVLHGAQIKSCDGVTLKEVFLEPDVVVNLIDIAREKNLAFQAFQNDCLLIEKRKKWHNLYIKYSYQKPEIIHVNDMNSVLKNKITQFSFLGEKSDLIRLKKLIKNQMESKISIACSHDNLLEIVGPDVNKGNALIELADILNTPVSQVITIGDSYNDIEMIKIAGLGVAMGNAPSKVKDAADFVTKDNNHEGISYFISKFISTSH